MRSNSTVRVKNAANLTKWGLNFKVYDEGNTNKWVGSAGLIPISTNGENFGGLIGDYDSVYQGTIFIPISNDVFLGIAGSGQNVTSTEANQLFEAQQ